MSIAPSLGEQRSLRIQMPIQVLDMVEIELTTKCDLHCVHCDRRCSQAPSSEEMSLRQVQYFVEESRRLNYHWKRINVLGGEPSLHKDLPAVVEALRTLNVDATNYGETNSPLMVGLWVVTNGYGPKAMELARHKLPGAGINNTSKTCPVNPYFVNVDVTAIEGTGETDVVACNHVVDCGLGFSRYGIYPCGPGASIDRVLRLGIGIRALSSVTVESIVSQMRILCRYCGWSPTIRDHNPVFGYTSPFWKYAYEQYALGNHKPMPLYGDS